MGLRTVRALLVVSLGLACLALPRPGFAQGDGGVRVATVDELLAAVAAGGLVTVEPGDYVIAETLLVGVDVELRGVEPLAATLYLQGAPLGLRVEGAAHAHLVGLRLAYDADAPGDVVWVHDARLTLDDVAVGLAVGVPDAEEGADAFGRGLVLTGASRADVLGGGLGRHERAAVEVRDGSILHVAGALVVGNGAGIVALDDASVTMTATEVRDHVGFAVAARDRAVVTGGGNLFEENGVAEDDRLISVAYVGDEASLSLSGGDVFHDNPGGAFEIAGAARVTLVDTTVESIGTWAHTYVVEQATLLVEGGRFAGNEGGFYAGDGARIELRGVVMTGGASDAVFADGYALVEVVGGRIDDHVAFGITLADHARGIVEGVTVARNRSGLVATGGSTLIVRDADVIDHERTGIAYLDVSLGTASANRVVGNGWTGLVVAGEATASLLGNVLEANGERAAWFDEAGSGRFAGNTVRGSVVGLEIGRDASVEVGENAFEDVEEAMVVPE
jgi:hypothetical protein